MKISCIRLIPTLICLAHPLLAVVSQEDEILIRSEWWPPQIELTEPFLAEGVLKNGLKPGRKGFVIRVEDGKVLTDFGRFGVHALDFDQTDFMDRRAVLSQHNTWDDKGVLMTMIGNKIFGINPVNFYVLPFDQVNAWDYLAFVYYKPYEDESDAAVAKLGEFNPSVEGVSFTPVLMPDTKDYSGLLGYTRTRQVTLPTMVPPTVAAYRNIFAFTDEQPAMVVTDRNGRVLRRYGSNAFSDMQQLNQSVEDLIAEDVRIRRQLSEKPHDG